MRAAVIDIGSSSVKLFIGESDGDSLRILESLKNLLGAGKSTFYRGRIASDVFNELITILENYKKVIAQYSVDSVKVIATTAVREADNKDIFIDTIQRKTGLAVEVLNVGDVVYYIDSFLSYKLNKAYPIHEKNLLIAELGAGSLDISVMEKGYTLMNLGIPVGTLRLKQFKNRMEGSQAETYEALREFVENEILSIKKLLPDIKIDDVILIDESYSAAIQNVLPNKKRDVNFFKFSYQESKKFLSRVTSGNLDDLAFRYDMPLDIAESVDGYAVVLNKLFKFIKGKSLYILETSLSEAILANLLFDVEISKKYNKSNQLISVAKFLCGKFEADVKHTKHVAMLSEQLFDQLNDMLGLTKESKLYLIMAAYLHNIGSFINNRSYHKHSEYIISALSLFRLTDEEIKVIACTARYHRKSPPQKTHFVYNSLSFEEQILVQKLSAILRLAKALDSSHRQKIKQVSVVWNARKKEISIGVQASQSLALEKILFDDMKTFFEEIVATKINLQITMSS